MDGNGDPWLLTPGPLTTSESTKKAMLRDFGSRDTAFIEMNRRVRDGLLEIINASESHVCVCMQGSGTFAIEAAVGTLISPDDKLLVLINGAYGKRMVKICQILNRNHCSLEWPEDRTPDPAQVEGAANLIVMSSASGLVAVAPFVREANNRGRLRAVLVHQDVEPRWMVQMLERAGLRVLRNMLVHVYWQVDYDRVYEILRTHLDNLRACARAIGALL